MASNILNFSPDRLITGINIIDGMLFFTDNENEPKKINIEKFKGNSVDPQSGKTIEVSHNKTTKIYGRQFKERDITVLKEHPTETLSTFLTESADLEANELSSYTTYNPDPAPGAITGGKDEEVSNSNQNYGLIVSNITNPSAASIDNVNLVAQVGGFNDIEDTGFIWSQDYSTDADLISNGNTISTGAKKTQGVNNFITQTFGTNIEPSALDATKEIIYFLPYAQAKGSDTKVYTQFSLDKAEVQEFLIKTGANAINVSNSITSLVVGARQGGKSEIRGFENSIELSADYVDSGIWPEQVGFYVSKGFSLDADTITLQELIESAESKAQENILEDMAVPLKLAGRLAATSKHFVSNASYSIEQGLNYFYIAYIIGSNGKKYYSSNSFASGTTTPSLTENVTTKIRIVPTQGGEGIPPRVENGEGKSINATPPSAEAVGQIIFQGITNARTGFITEYGFYFSKKVSSKEQFITAFSSGVQGDGSPVKSGFPDTYKVAVESNSSGVANVDINNSSFSYDVGNKLSLSDGELVFFMAYAISSTGAEGTATSLGVSIYPEIGKVYAGTGEVFEDPVISILKSDYSVTTSDFLGPVAFDITYRIEYVPPGKQVMASGVYLSLPRRDAIADNLNGYESPEVIKEQSPSEYTLASIDHVTGLGNFTFTPTSSTADHGAIGDYNGVVNPPAHSKADDAEYFKFGAARVHAYSLFAYVTVKDNATQEQTTIETAVVTGRGHKLVFGSNVISSNIGAPTVKTHSNDLKSVDQGSIRNNTFKLLGSIGSDGSKFPTAGEHAANEVGFYISKTKPVRSLFSTFELDMAAWTASSDTVKVVLTGSALTAARTHSISGGLTFQNFEIVVNLASHSQFSSDTAPTDYHFKAFAIPSQQDPTVVDSATINKTKFGGTFTVTTISSSQSLNTNPVVTTDSYRTSEGFGFTLRGTARPTENTYIIKTKKFYYKDASHFPANPTDSQIVTELQDPTGRSSILATGEDNFSANVNLSNLDYYFIAVVTIELNGTESSEIFASEGRKIANAQSVIANNKVPDPSIKTLIVQKGNPPSFGAKITSGLSAISNRGFYFVGKEGTNSLSKPSTGAALKTAATSVPSGQVGGTISSSTTSEIFRESFTNFKTDHTYFFSAFAINSAGVETITPPRAVPIVQSNTPKTLKVSPSLIKFDSRGTQGIRGNMINISVQTTPNANTWSYKTTNFVPGGFEKPDILRETSGGVDKLKIKGFPLNSRDNAEALITITHKDDPSIKSEIIILQDGMYNDNFNYDSDPNDWNNYQPPGFYY